MTRCLPKTAVLLVLVLALAGCGRKSQPPAASQAPKTLPNRIVRVLCYHNLVTTGGGFYDTTVETFQTQLKVLKDGGFQAISCRQLSDYLANVRDIPDKSVIITFDDGRSSVLGIAKPLLDKCGYVATLFPIVGSVGSKGNLTWEELKQLSAAGYEIGSHTVSHLNLTRRGSSSLQAWQDRVRDELEESFSTLVDKLGQPPVALAYPFGNYDTFTMRAAKDAGYQLAFSIDPGVVDNQSDLWRLPRRMVVKGLSLSTFERSLVTEPLHLTEIEPAIGLHVGAKKVKLSAAPRDGSVMTGMQAEVGAHSDLQLDQEAGRLTVTATLRPGANLVRLWSPGPPWRETGWIIVSDATR